MKSTTAKIGFTRIVFWTISVGTATQSNGIFKELHEVIKFILQNKYVCTKSDITVNYTLEATNETSVPKVPIKIVEEILKMEKMISINLIFPGTWEMTAVNQF